jgi:4'-phosphopantetheinyl transferase EntD
MIETLFPPGVVTQAATPEMWSGTLRPEEAACLSPRAVEKRRREFTAGRVCARAALERLGVRDYPLLAGADRAPIWPSGVVGSLSHCDDYCGVAVACRGAVAGLGLDVERLRPLAGRVIELVCTPSEADDLAALPGMEPALWALVAFCAKESAYKCYYPATGVHLGFHDVTIRLDSGAGTFEATVAAGDPPRGSRQGRGAPADRPVAPHARPGPRLLRGRFACGGGHVFAGVALTGGEAAGTGEHGASV